MNICTHVQFAFTIFTNSIGARTQKVTFLNKLKVIT